MKKRKRFFYMVAGLLIIISALAFSLEWPVLFVNGKPIYPQELDLNGNMVERVVRSRVILDWANESGEDENISYQQICRAMEDENRRRQEQIHRGEAVYGPAEYDLIQYYKKYIGDCERRIREQLELRATQDALISFYNNNLENYRHIDTICADYSVWQNGQLTTQGTIQLDQYNARGLSETSEALVEKLLLLQPQQQIVWNVAEGIQVQFFCSKREMGQVAPFEEVAGAVLQQYSAWLFEIQLEERVEESTVWNFNIHNRR